MAKIEASVVVDRPVEDVWKFATDLSKLPKWVPGVLEGKMTSEGPLGVGATLQTKHSTRPNLIEFRITEYEPGRKCTMEVTAPRMMRGSREILVLENAEGKTKLNYAWDLKLNGLYSLAGPFVVPSFRRECQTQVGNLKRTLESEPQP